MRIDSYTIVHYGIDYLPYALQSIYNQMTQLHIVWTPHPSHGHGTKTPPPETREQIYTAAFTHDTKNKIRWYEVHNTYQEGQHRDKALSLCQDAGADMVVVLDCDEVWQEQTLIRAVDYAWKQNKARNWLINFTHFWRSFGYCCRDENWPVRIIDFRHQDGVGYIPKELGEIYHFGYAVRDSLMHYKWEIHGHKNELRQNWFSEKWGVWPPARDCHPTNSNDWWMPIRFNRAQLPTLMKAHPFYNLERID